MERREQTVPEQRGLLDGMTAWRLIVAFSRRPEEAIADDGSGSGRPTTIRDGSQSWATVDELPREASQLPCRRPATTQPTETNLSSSKSPREEEKSFVPWPAVTSLQKIGALLTEVPAAPLPIASGSDHRSTATSRSTTKQHRIQPAGPSNHLLARSQAPAWSRTPA